MSAFNVTHRMRLDGVAVIQTLTPTDVTVGQSVVVAGVGDGFDGTRTIVAVPTARLIRFTDEGDPVYDWDQPIINQLAYLDTGPNVERNDIRPFGTITWIPTCTWVSSANVTEFLGIAVASSNDTAFITTCVNAANAWAYRKRQEAGYRDSSLSVAPDAAVKLGTIMFAAAMYRRRGSIDGFQSFDVMDATTPPMTMGEIHKLLGINRSQVA